MEVIHLTLFSNDVSAEDHTVIDVMYIKHWAQCVHRVYR